jgi:hypothetical protein
MLLRESRDRVLGRPSLVRSLFLDVMDDRAYPVDQGMKLFGGERGDPLSYVRQDLREAGQRQDDSQHGHDKIKDEEDD